MNSGWNKPENYGLSGGKTQKELSRCKHRLVWRHESRDITWGDCREQTIASDGGMIWVQMFLNLAQKNHKLQSPSRLTQEEANYVVSGNGKICKSNHDPPRIVPPLSGQKSGGGSMGGPKKILRKKPQNFGGFAAQKNIPRREGTNEGGIGMRENAGNKLKLCGNKSNKIKGHWEEITQDKRHDNIWSDCTIHRLIYCPDEKR